MRLLIHSIGAVVFFAQSLALAQTETPKRDLLWKVVREECIERKVVSNPSQCKNTDVGPNALLLQDRKSPTHQLLIPITPVKGIEDTQVVLPSSPNYWHAAWIGSAEIGRAMNRNVPRDIIAMAINPAFDRSQDQLHIHIDCMKPSVFSEIKRVESTFGEDWNQNAITLEGATYRVKLIERESLGDVNPFVLLAEDLGSTSEMGNHTLVLVGAFIRGRPGFYLLDRKGLPYEGKPEPATRVHGEDLQDFTCAIGRDAQ